MHIIFALIIGGISGFIASRIMDSDLSLIKNVILGIVGGVIGDLIFGLVGISSSGYLGNIIVSIVGSCLLLFIANKVFK